MKMLTKQGERPLYYLKEGHCSCMCNLCSCEKRKPEKIQAYTGFEPFTSAILVQRSTN